MGSWYNFSLDLEKRTLLCVDLVDYDREPLPSVLVSLTCLLTVGTVALPGFAQTEPAAAGRTVSSTAKPNILVIMGDDIGIFNLSATIKE